MATYWENSCSFGLRYVSWYKYLIVSLVFSHLGFWSGNLFLIAPFPDLCLLVPFQKSGSVTLILKITISINCHLKNCITHFSSIYLVFIENHPICVKTRTWQRKYYKFYYSSGNEVQRTFIRTSSRSLFERSV